MTKASVARIVRLVINTSSRTTTPEVLEDWHLVLESLPDGDDVIPIVLGLIRESRFSITAGDVFRAVAEARAEPEGDAPAPEHPETCRCAGTGWLEVTGTADVRRCPGLSVVKAPKPPADPKRWLRKARGKSEAAQAPPARKKALDPAEPRPWLKPDEHYFAPPEPAPEKPSNQKESL